MSRQIWIVDIQHSSILFKVKHMIISTATGQFQRFGANVATDGEGFENAEIEVEITADSVNTNESYRDEHLRSEALFETEKYPNIRFISTEFTKEDDQNFLLTGNLTIKNITQSMVFPVKFIGIMKYDQQIRAAFEASFVIHRKDFKLIYSPMMETGGMVLADDVHISAHISLVKETNVKDIRPMSFS